MLSDFCTELQNLIILERVGKNANMDVEEILVRCLRRIIELETQLDKLSKPESIPRKSLIKRVIRT